MAKTRLSSATYVTKGYGQVEPNHLSGQKTGQIFAQLPAAKAIETLENGMFVKYDIKSGECNFAGAGEWMMVFNEVKIYEDKKSVQDFAMIKGEMNMVPRTIKLNVGDTYTTNTIKETTVALGDELSPGADGFLLKIVKSGTAGSEAYNVADPNYRLQVAKIYTMPDGQKGVKLVRIQ